MLAIYENGFSSICRHVLVIASTLVLTVCGFAHGGVNTWTTNGQPDRVVNALTAAGDSIFFAATERGIFLSTDDANTWRSLGGLLVDTKILSIAVDKLDSTRVFAGVNTGLFYSPDRGITWIEKEDVDTGILSLASAQNNSPLMLAGSFGRGVFVSSDRGATWNNSNFLSNDIVFSVMVSPWDGQTGYAGTTDGLFITRDSGISWNRLGAALAGADVRSINTSPEPNVLVVGTFGRGIFRSEDGGETWTSIASDLKDFSVRDLAVDPRSDAVIYAATSTGGLFRTRNLGDSWTPINDGLTEFNVRFVTLFPNDPDRVFSAGMDKGVFNIRFMPQPHISVSQKKLDFGSTAVGRERILSLSLINSGEASLSIVDLNLTDINPFSTNVTTPFEIPAESHIEITVRFIPNDAGNVHDSLVILSNDPDQPVLNVPLNGLGIQARVRAAPETIDFGSIRISSFLDTTVVLTNVGNASVTLENAIFDNNDMRVLSFSRQKLQPGQNTVVTVRFVPQIRTGINATLSVHTDITTQRVLEIETNAIGVAPDLTVSTDTVDFGTIDIGATSTLSVNFQNTGNADLKIDDISIDSLAFDIFSNITTENPLILAPGAEHEIEVVFLPAASRNYTGTVMISCDVPEFSGPFRIPLTGNGGAVALTPGEEVSAGLGPVDMLSIDLDADGDVDIAIADSTSGHLLVLANDGLGLYPETQSNRYPNSMSKFVQWDEPVAIAAGRIFSSVPDLICADSKGQLISILRNDGSGGFGAERLDVFVGNSISDVIAVDLDTDGDVDIAVSHGDLQSVTLLLNNDEAGFNARSDIQVGLGPSALSSANLNFDGYNDLVVANRVSGTVSILINDREGGFLSRQDIGTGQEPVAIVVVDYDTDGDNDVLSANFGSRDVTIASNVGTGLFNTSVMRIPIGMHPQDIALSDLTADIFSDLMVVSNQTPFLAFFENDGGLEFTGQDIVTGNKPARRILMSDADSDGDNDVFVLSTVVATVQAFFNENIRRPDPPRVPTYVNVVDQPRDLGRNLVVSWQAPELDEQIGRVSGYSIFRSASFDGPFEQIGIAAAGSRSFIDVSATMADTFYYFVRAGNAAVESANSDTVFGVSQPAPFFGLELVNEPKLSVGDTLRVRVSLTPTIHDIAGVSLYLSYKDSALTLISADSSGATVVPFRIDKTLAGATAIENRLHPMTTGKINISMTGLSIGASVRPVALGEIWFRTVKDRSSSLTIDDDAMSNRRSSVVEYGSGTWILPYLPSRPTQIAVRDFKMRGSVLLEGRGSQNLDLQVTLTLIDSTGLPINSLLNDEDRLTPGIQYTLDQGGMFSLQQIPSGKYVALLKAPSHLQGMSDSVFVGDSLNTNLSFTWIRSDSSSAAIMGAGDANNDNKINLGDYGTLVRYFNVSSSSPNLWPQAQTADFNGDEVVNVDDFFLLAQNFGEIGAEVVKTANAKHSIYDRLGFSARLKGSVLEVAGNEEILAFSLEFNQNDSPSFFHFVGTHSSERWTKGTIFEGRKLQVRSVETGSKVYVLAGLSDGSVATNNVSSGHSVLLDFETIGIDLEGVRRVDILLENGSIVDVSILDVTHTLPSQTELLQNYPNPFNPSTTIPFSVGADFGVEAFVKIDIFDLLGQRIRRLADGPYASGLHSLTWDGQDQNSRSVAAGVYFYRLQVAPINGRIYENGKSSNQKITGIVDKTRSLILVR